MKHYLYFLLIYVTVVTGCSNAAHDDKKATPAPVKAPSAHLMAPFRYHKTVEVAPGLYYDVLAWGRGSETMGAFEILRSDSASMKYTTTTGDLEGRIIDVYNADMDTDGNPEIFVHTQAADSTSAARVYAFEYNEENARKIEFPKLSRSQRKGYRGNDSFFVKDGNLMREFNVYADADSLAKKPIQKRLIEYNLRGNELSSKQISTDSTMNEEAGTKQSNAAVSSQPKSESRKTEMHSSKVKERSSSHRSSSRHKTSHKRETSRRRRRHR